MYARVSYFSDDFYCRYLSCNIHNQHGQLASHGRFGNYLSKYFGINKLPYDLKISDLVVDGLISPSAVVRLPNEFFIAWTGYPELGGGLHSSASADARLATKYDIDIGISAPKSLADLGHPYDFELKKIFINKFSVSLPEVFEGYEHPNGRRYVPYEVYIPYWQGFLLVIVLEDCKFVERYLKREAGIALFKEKLSNRKNLWIRYSEAFERISHYRTMGNQLVIAGTDNTDWRLKEISEYALNISDSTVEDIQIALGLLLELYERLSDLKRRDGLQCVSSALDLLKRDIYFAFKWLRGCGCSEAEIFDRWSDSSGQKTGIASLGEVLEFEEFKLKNCFTRLVEVYRQDATEKIKSIDLAQCYERLQALDGFYPWARAFYDLHEGLNSTSQIELAQSRVLDNLLVLTIRTEILIRAISHQGTGKYEKTLVDIFKNFESLFIDEKPKKVMSHIRDKKVLEMTELYSRPEDSFDRINDLVDKKNWSNEQKNFLKSMMYFVTARNYFAHHSFKDNEFSYHTNQICGDVLKACLYSVVYIHGYTIHLAQNET